MLTRIPLRGAGGYSPMTAGSLAVRPAARKGQLKATKIRATTVTSMVRAR